MFAVLASVATVSKRDFSGMGTWLFAGVVILLLASIANIFLQLAGPEGLSGLAAQNAAKAQHLRERLLELPDFEPAFDVPFFNEFVLRYAGDPAALEAACLQESLLPGLDLGRFYPEYRGCVLWCATELHTRQMIESLVEVLARVSATF